MDTIICSRCGFEGKPLGKTEDGRFPLFHTEKGKPELPVCNRCRNYAVKLACGASQKVTFFPLERTLQWEEEREVVAEVTQERQEEFIKVFRQESATESPYSGVDFLNGTPHADCPLCGREIDLSHDPMVAPKEPGSHIPSVLVDRYCLWKVGEVAKGRGYALKYFYPLSDSKKRDEKADDRRLRQEQEEMDRAQRQLESASSLADFKKTLKGVISRRIA